MTLGFHRNDSVKAPRPLFDCLDGAIRAALHNGTRPEEMIQEKWCSTYHATPEQFDAAMLRAQTRIDPNSIEAEGK